MSDEAAELAFFIMLTIAVFIVALVAAGAMVDANPVIVTVGELR